MDKDQLKKHIGKSSLSLVEVMQHIDVNAHGILFIVDEEGCLQGTVTDGDIRRWIIRTGKLNAGISEIMNRNPKFLYQKDMKLAQEYMHKTKVKILPIVDVKCRIVDAVFESIPNIVSDKIDTTVLGNVPVVIMAGGKGTRLYPYTKILPKPLIPIKEIPIMERIINMFCNYGVWEYYITVNYRKKMIESYFSEMEHDYQIHYVEEDKPLGTAGSLRLLHRKFDNPIIVTNCDILIRADYAAIYKNHQEFGNDLTIVTALKNEVIPYGVVYSKENGEVSHIEEKPSHLYLVNTGMYVVNPEILELIPRDTFFHMTHLTDKVLKLGYKVGMYPVSEDSFLDMGEFAEMKRMEEKVDL